MHKRTRTGRRKQLAVEMRGFYTHFARKSPIFFMALNVVDGFTDAVCFFVAESAIMLQMEIALIGYGNMGRLVKALAAEKGHSVNVIVNEAHQHLPAEQLAETLRAADVQRPRKRGLTPFSRLRQRGLTPFSREVAEDELRDFAHGVRG